VKEKRKKRAIDGMCTMMPDRTLKRLEPKKKKGNNAKKRKINLDRQPNPASPKQVDLPTHPIILEISALPGEMNYFAEKGPEPHVVLAP
jgi:hypothetical protein